MTRKVGDTYRPIVHILKVKKDKPTVIEVDGEEYVLRHKDQFRGGKSKGDGRMKRSKKQIRKHLNNKPVTVTAKEREKMQRKATNDAVQITNLFNLWVLRTKYGFGEKRLREFMDHYNELLDSFNRDYVSLPDIAQQLEKETGIRLD